MANHLHTRASSITAVLPNGRVVWMQVAPPLAPERSLDQVARLAEVSAARRQAATREVTTSLRAASSQVSRDSAQLTAARLRAARAMRRRLATTYDGLDRKFSKAARVHRQSAMRTRRIADETARRLRTRSTWDAILLASSAPLFAAYGDRSRPFGAHNLTLALSTLVWLGGDEFVDVMFGREDNKSPYPIDAPDTWSYIAPIGNWLGGWWLLGGRQHERFVTGHQPLPSTAAVVPIEGTTRFSYHHVAIVDLSPLLAPEHAPDFLGYTDVPAVASLASVKWTPAAAARNAQISVISALVTGVELRLVVTAEADGELVDGVNVAPTILTGLDVAWMVDARPANQAQRN